MKAILLACSLLISIEARAEILLGTARNDKNEIVYLEQHKIERESTGFTKFIRVEYSKPDGKVFAVMTSDFSKNKMVPETVFEDNRFQSRTTLQLTETMIEFEDFKGGKSVSKVRVPRAEEQVASQGFDNFVREKFDEMLSKPVDFQFGVLTEKSFFSLTGYKRSSNFDESEFGIKTSNWLLRLFAGELKVKYNTKTRRLISFEGRSNVPDDSGRAQNVLIRYEWKEAP